MKVFIFLVFLSISSFALVPPKPFDFIEDAILKYVNHSVDPCENFYRHACSFDSPNELITDSLKKVYAYLEEAQRNSYWNRLDVYNDQPPLYILENAQAVVELYTNTFKTVCETRKELLPEISKRILLMTVLSFEEETEMDQKIKKRKFLFEERDCESTTEDMKNTIKENLSKNKNSTFYFVDNFEKLTTRMIELAKGIISHLDVDVRQGIEETRKMVEETLKIAGNLIKDTPWAKNKNVVETIKKITSQLAIHDNYGEDFKLVADTLFALERNYTDCKNKFKFIEYSDVFCYIATAKTFKFPENLEEEGFTLEENAFNAHPVLIFGYPNYYHSQYGKEMSTKLGYTGVAVGHEIGHTFFDKHDGQGLLPYFSKEVEDCVQNQYNKTCIEFKEESCAVTDDFLEENGADVFGMQLAYELLKNYYGFKITGMIERVQVTHEQAFFYSFAFSYCNRNQSNVLLEDDGSYEGHSAYNVRVNAVAQHPGFREAFNCPSESRMMMSATEQCHIYGNEAPDTRRRKFKY